MKNLLYSTFVLLTTLLFHNCTHKAAFTGTPTPKYQTAEEAGFNSQKLQQLDDYIKKNSNTTGLVVLYDGKVIYEYGDVERISYIASCRKSVLSMLYGKYVDDGTVDLNETIGEIGIDEKDGLLPIEKMATVDDVLQSRSGVHHVASNGGYDKDNFQERGSVEPGEFWVYNNWDFNVAGEILERKTGNSVYQELEDQMAVPLGFQDWNIKNQKKSGNKRKSQYQAYHMYLSTRDMAKIGQLMLNNGVWEGEQLISKDWIKKTTSTVTPFEIMIERYGPADPEMPYMSYGYMWWLIDSFKDDERYVGGYSALGYGGQWIMVLPAAKMVIAHKTKLNLLTLAGISYKATENPEYYSIVNQILNAKKERP